VWIKFVAVEESISIFRIRIGPTMYGLEAADMANGFAIRDTFKSRILWTRNFKIP